MFFIFKGKEHKKERKIKVPYFLRGAVLNLISIQVLLYWIIAVAALQPYIAFSALSPEILLFITGIFTGKILILYVYALSGEKLIDKWQLIALNINRIIGTILLIAMIFQIVKT